MRLFIKLIKTNYRQLMRDKTALFMTFAFPVVFMVVFGLIMTGDNNFQAKIGLVTNDSSPTTQAISQAFKNINVLTVVEGTQIDELDQLRKGRLNAVIVIPEGVQNNIAAGAPCEISVYYDPSQTITAQVILPVISRVIEGIEQQITLRPTLLNLKEESIQAREMRNIDYMVPGIVAMSILSTGLFCAMPLIQQREKKILKRWGATPIRRSSIIYSQVFFRVMLAMLQTIILVCLAHFGFQVQILGNFVIMFGLVALGTLTFVSLGYLIASFVRTQEGAMPVLQLVQFPFMFLSGMFFPIDAMPGFMKPVVKAIPMTYFADSLRQIMIQASPVSSMTLNLFVLCGWLIVCMLLSIKLFRWE